MNILVIAVYIDHNFVIKSLPVIVTNKRRHRNLSRSLSLVSISPILLLVIYLNIIFFKTLEIELAIQERIGVEQDSSGFN